MKIGRVKLKEMDVALNAEMEIEEGVHMIKFWFKSPHKSCIQEFLKPHKLWKCSGLNRKGWTCQPRRYVPKIIGSIEEMRSYYTHMKLSPLFKLDFDTIDEICMRLTAEAL